MLFTFDRRPRRRLYLSPCCFLRSPLLSLSLRRDVSTVGPTLPHVRIGTTRTDTVTDVGTLLPLPSLGSLCLGLVCVAERGGEERHQRLVATRKRAGVDVTSHTRNTSVRERQWLWHDGERTTKQHQHAASAPWKNEGTEEEEEMVWDLQRRTRHGRGTSATEPRRKHPRCVQRRMGCVLEWTRSEESVPQTSVPVLPRKKRKRGKKDGMATETPRGP